MTVFFVIVALVVLVALTGIISRLGSEEHQEALNTHDRDSIDDPLRDRPAGPGAEAMGVDGPGEPGLRGDG